MTRRNKIGLGLVLFVLAALVAWALRPQPISVEIAQATKGAFEQTVSDDGQTRVRDRYVIAAPLAGHAERTQLEVGDPVKQGQIVAELTPTAPAFLDVRTQRELRERIGAAEAQQTPQPAVGIKVICRPCAKIDGPTACRRPTAGSHARLIRRYRDLNARRQRTKAGTRKAPSQFEFFSPWKGVVPASGQVL